MDNIGFSSVKLPLKPSQIVCLEHQGSILYGEVIQLIPHRQRCWFRPLCLVISDLKSNPIWRSPEFTRNQQKYSSRLGQNSLDPFVVPRGNTEVTKLIDLQSSSDLLWPESMFRPALDTEIIHLLPQLKDISDYPGDKKYKQNYLNQFVQLVWQADQDKF